MTRVLYRIEFQFKTFPSLNIHWTSWFHFPVVIQVDFQLTNGRQREKEGRRQRGWRGESSRCSGPESRERERERERERRGRERGEVFVSGGAGIRGAE